MMYKFENSEKTYTLAAIAKELLNANEEVFNTVLHDRYYLQDVSEMLLAYKDNTFDILWVRALADLMVKIIEDDDFRSEYGIKEVNTDEM